MSGNTQSTYPFTLLHLRYEVNTEKIGFSLPGDKAKPVHFANGLYRNVLAKGRGFCPDLLLRMVYVVDAKGGVKEKCEIEQIMTELQKVPLIDSGIAKEDVQRLRRMMQGILSADSSVFGPHGSDVSYSAASSLFVTPQARYEDVGEFFAEILRLSAPTLVEFIQEMLESETDEITQLFKPFTSLPRAVSTTKGKERIQLSRNSWRSVVWKKYLETVKASGCILLTNLRKLPKLQALRMVIFFSIFHLIRYLGLQEAFLRKDGDISDVTFLVACTRNPALLNASRSSFLQLGQSLSRFYTEVYCDFLPNKYGCTVSGLLSKTVPPDYRDPSKNGKSTTPARKAKQNAEIWKIARAEACELQQHGNAGEALKRIARAFYDMTATASETSPLKYIRGLGLATGILHPPAPRITPYFRFAQDVTSMLVLASVESGKKLSGREFLSNLRENFGIVTGAAEDDYEFCSAHVRVMNADENELSHNGDEFIHSVCEMGYGTILADGISQITTGI